jgi:hypothetical protein
MSVANRILERDIPYEAVAVCRLIAPILTGIPLRFGYKGLVIVAYLVGRIPCLISVGRADEVCCAPKGITTRRPRSFPSAPGSCGIFPAGTPAAIDSSEKSEITLPAGRFVTRL